MYSVSALEEPKLALMATSAYKTGGFTAPPADLTLHVYDHCPYCTRVELFLVSLTPATCVCIIKSVH